MPILTVSNASQNTEDRTTSQNRDELTSFLETIISNQGIEHLESQGKSIVQGDISKALDQTSLPFLGFIENVGQLNDLEVGFYYSSPNSKIEFSKSKVRIWQNIGGDEKFVSFVIQFDNANDVYPVALNKMDHYTNYFKGTTQHSNIGTWEEVWYYGLYSNIDLRYYMTPLGLKYDFIILPGGDPSQIAIDFSDDVVLEVFANEVSIRKDFESINNIITDTKLEVFQQDSTPVQASFRIINQNDRIYGFELEDYDQQQPLIIDPLLLGFSTYYGGNLQDLFNELVIGPNGNIYVVGQTRSFSASTDVVVIEYDSTGTSIVMSTTFGGDGSDYGRGIAVDNNGHIFVTGDTQSSTGFPTTSGAYNEGHNGGTDAFLVKLDTDGSILNGTYFGGSNNDVSEAIAIDTLGNIFIAGRTSSTDFTATTGDTTWNFGNYDGWVAKFENTDSLLASTYVGGSGTDEVKDLSLDVNNYPYIVGITADHTTDYPTTPGVYNRIHQGRNDVFVTKLDVDLSSHNFSTLIGGNTNDEGYAISVDADGHSYITGRSYYLGTSQYPTTPGAYDVIHDTGNYDIFVTKLSNDGSTLNYSTYLGGDSTSDYGYDIAIDSSGNAYVTGVTASSTDFPLVNAFDDTIGGSTDTFVVKLNASGNDVEMATYLGGSTSENGYGITVDDFGNIWVVGGTTSNNFPVMHGVDGSHNGGFDGFLLKLSNKFSTYLGGSSSEGSSTINHDWDVHVDDQGYIYIIGQSYDATTEFPTTFGSLNETHNGFYDVIVAKLNPSGTSLLFSTFIGGAQDDIGHSITTDALGNIYITGYTTKSGVNNFPVTAGAFNETHTGGKDVFVAKLNYQGNTLLASTFIGGGTDDVGEDIKVDSDGNVYVGGWSNDPFSALHFPSTEGSADETHSSGADGFLVKLNNSLNSMVFSTFIGGTGTDNVYNIVLDTDGTVIMTGRTSSTVSFPLQGAEQGSNGGGIYDAFVTKINKDGSSINFSTFLGGSAFDVGSGIALDSARNIYVTGVTTGSFPTINPLDGSIGGAYDAFVVKYNPSASSILYSTYFGGSGDEYGYEVAIDSANRPVIVGYTSSTDMTTVKPVYASLPGYTSAFVLQLNSTGNTIEYSTYLGGNSGDYGLSIDIGIDDSVIVTGFTNSNDYPTTQGARMEDQIGNSDAFLTNLGPLSDKSGPSISLTNVYDTQIVQPTQDIMVEVRDLISPIVDVSFQWDTSGFISAEPNSDLYEFTSNIPDTSGGHVLTVVATDNSGNVATELFNFEVDNLVPVITLNTVAEGDELQTAVNIDLDIADINTIIEVNYHWDSFPDTPTIFPYKVPTPSGNGVHILNVTATDIAGNIGNTNFSFIIDNIGPSVELLNVNNNANILPGSTVSFNVTDVNTISRVRYQWDNPPDTLKASPYDVDAPSNEATHVLFVEAEDNAGNPTTVSFSFFVDDTPPQIALVNLLDGDLIGSTVLVAIGVIETHNLDRVQYHWDTDNYVDLSAPYNSIPVPNSAGPHTLYVQVEDEAGNIATSIYTFTVDNQLPETILSTLKDGDLIKPNTPVILGITDDNLVSEVTYRWNSGIDQLLPKPYTSITSPTTDGNHTLVIIATDEAGNTATTTFIFTIDGTPPTISLSGVVTGEILKSGTAINLVLQDDNGLLSVEYRWDTADSNIPLSEPYIGITTPFGEGSHTLYVLAEDRAGNQITTNFNFIVDDTPPLANAIGIGNNDVFSGSVDINIQAQDSNGVDYVSIQLDGVEFFRLESSPFTFTWDTTTLSNGKYILAFLVVDEAGNETPLIFNVEIENKSSENQSPFEETLVIGLIVATSLGGGGLVFQRLKTRKTNKALDELESSFVTAEDSGFGKLD